MKTLHLVKTLDQVAAQGGASSKVPPASLSHIYRGNRAIPQLVVGGVSFEASVVIFLLAGFSLIFCQIIEELVNRCNRRFWAFFVIGIQERSTFRSLFPDQICIYTTAIVKYASNVSYYQERVKCEINGTSQREKCVILLQSPGHDR